jgi:membrane-bound inhibitor of C-type lysozyme
MPLGWTRGPYPGGCYGPYRRPYGAWGPGPGPGPGERVRLRLVSRPERRLPSPRARALPRRLLRPLSHLNRPNLQREWRNTSNFFAKMGFGTPVMARFAKRFALLSAVALIPFAGPAGATEAHYTCSGGGKLSANFSPPDAAKGEVKLTFDTGRELRLPEVLSADGGRYANAGIEFWIKGKTATLTMSGVKETCSTQ